MTKHDRRTSLAARWRRAGLRWSTAAAVATAAFAALRLAVAAGHPHQAGALDLRFNHTGTRIVSFSIIPAPGAVAHSVAVQRDGKLVTAVTLSIAGTHLEFALMRFNADGSTDTTFSGGLVVLDPTADVGEARAVTIQKDGKIVAAGDLDGDLVAARLNPNGTPDTTFHGDGIARATFGDGASAASVGIQKDGRIVAAGSTRTGVLIDFALARFNTDGSLDSTFNGSGKVATDFGGQDSANGIAIQNDGRIVAAGGTFGGGLANGFALARYGQNGSLDTTFGGTGKVTTDFGGTNTASGVAVQKDGRIVAAGYVEGGGSADLALARFNTDGSLDARFGDPVATPGRVRTDLGGAEHGYAVALQKDGKIVVAGARSAGADEDFLVTRYRRDGRLDSSFSSEGWVATDLGGTDQARALAIQKDGKIVAGGTTASAGGVGRVALARYLAR